MAEKRESTRVPYFRGNFLRIAILVMAGLFTIQIFVAITGFPQEQIEDWLACEEMQIDQAPKYIFVIGSTIPSRVGLMNTYYAAEFGSNLQNVSYIIAMPVQGKIEQSDAWDLRDELVLRGVESRNILFETKGLNTYQQVRLTRDMLGRENASQPLLIVTSPLHMRRTLLCFQKQGIRNAMVLPAREQAGDFDLGPWTFIRYTFWYRLKFQAMIARELVALGGYKLKGWI